MNASAVMTLRLDPSLLQQVKTAARAEGRSVSSYVVRLLQGSVAKPLATPVTTGSWFGKFDHLESPDIEVFRAHRTAVGASVKRRARAKASRL